MSMNTSSLSQAERNVNTRYYSVALKPRIEAAQARRTPDQIERDNVLASKLRAQDAIVLRGPVVEGNVIMIPSWRWNPELVREIKSRPGYHFEKEIPYTVRVTLCGHDYTPTITMPTWTIPAEPGRLEAIRAVYEHVFACEMAAARATAQLEPLGRF